MAIPIHLSTTAVLISESDRQTALQFAKQQPTRDKAAQVYRNTLAVLVTKHCLDLLEIPSDLTKSDAWNPFSRLAADVADLYITGLGRLECRPVSPDEPYCYVPPETWEDRIGYLALRLDSSCQEATLLGFSASVTSEHLALAQLQPLAEFLLHLEWLKVQPPMNRLQQWLSHNVDVINDRWQSIDGLLGQLQQPVFAFRSFQGHALDTPAHVQQLVEQLYTSQWLGNPLNSVPLSQNPDFQAALVHLIQTTSDEETRWKAAEILWTIEPGHPETGIRRMLDLGLLLAGHHLALMVAMLPLGDRHLSILARVYPLADQDRLPAGLQLAVLEPEGGVELTIQARERDNYIQIKFSGEFDERFSIRLHLSDDVFTEHFVI